MRTKKILIAIMALAGIALLFISGCNSFLENNVAQVKTKTDEVVKEAKDAMDNVKKEATEAKEKVDETIKDVKEAIDSVNKAADSIKEAAENVDKAMEDVKNIGKSDNIETE